MEPLFSRLGEEDARFYRQMNEHDSLFQNIEALSRSSKGRWTRAIMDKVGQMVDKVG